MAGFTESDGAMVERNALLGRTTPPGVAPNVLRLRLMQPYFRLAVAIRGLRRGRLRGAGCTATQPGAPPESAR